MSQELSIYIRIIITFFSSFFISFLINKKCSVYKYRGLTCRTFGLAYLIDKKTVKVPECANEGLCYSKVYKDGELVTEPIKENLSLLKITNSQLAKSHKLEFGESRSLVDWFPDK